MKKEISYLSKRIEHTSLRIEMLTEYSKKEDEKGNEGFKFYGESIRELTEEKELLENLLKFVETHQKYTVVFGC